jgi:ABC-type glycerol-3-phosphate transport system substrate-binding protein
MRLLSGSGGISRRTLLKAGTAAAGAGALGALGGLATPALAASTSATITFAYFGDPKQATSMRESLLPLVKKADQNAELKVVGYNGTDWNDFFAKILTQIAAGTPPDIVGVATEGVQLMAGKDLAIPLDDYVKRDMAELKEMFDDVDPILIEGLMYDGHLFELPVNFNAGNMFYSTKLFQQAGLERPGDNWTIDDFHSYAKKIAAIPDVNAFDWVVRLWGSWTSFMYANGGNLLEEQRFDNGDWLWSAAYPGNPAVKSRKGGWKWGAPTANSAPTVEALQYMIDLRKEGLAPSPDVGGGGTLQGLFASNRIGMTIAGGFWSGGLHNAGMTPDSFDVQYFPKWKVQKHLFGVVGNAILKSSKNQDLAWEVVKQLSAADAFDLQFPGNATTPVRRSLMTPERYKTTGPEHWSVFYDTLTKFENTTPIPAPPYYNALANALNRRTTEAIASGDAKAALDGLQKDLEAAAKI